MVVQCFRRRRRWESPCSSVCGKIYFWIGKTSNLHFTMLNCCLIFFTLHFSFEAVVSVYLISSVLDPLCKSQIKILVKCCLMDCYIILAEKTIVTCRKLTVIDMQSKFKCALFRSRMIGTAKCGAKQKTAKSPSLEAFRGQQIPLINKEGWQDL